MADIAEHAEGAKLTSAPAAPLLRQGASMVPPALPSPDTNSQYDSSPALTERLAAMIEIIIFIHNQLKL